ncbi:MULTISPECIES: glycosyltransferase [Streptomyces]|uniref:glycosyltransferase n=1 Tax=Streptomyces TaxID=1883 RepID=UPI002248FB03|nr:glycosyltransferase [Streptomyces sp. JHD 1]MCX2970382.1 glycosyltransferase [Streptomyces sp. JHD 1]
MPHDRHPTRPLTVLHVAQPVDGGVASVVADLARAQAGQGTRVHLACPPGGPLADRAAAAGAAVHPWPAGRAPGAALPAEVLRLARLVRRLAPDVVHAHSAKAGLAARLALRGGVPTLFTPHAWSFDAVSGPARALALRWERAAARWADRVLCVSEDERRRGASAGIDARWAVVPNGVDLDRFRPAGPPPGPAGPPRHPADPASRVGPPALDGLPDAAPLLVCVARLCRQKGQDVLLRAWPAVRAAHPDARLVLVGDGPDRAALLDAAPVGVRLAGAAADPVPWYRAADLVVLPSRWEGMALAPLEAMACGRPVVLTDVTGARESLPADLRRVCLVPPEDPAALARALLRLLDDPALRARTARRAQDHVRAAHDARQTAAAVSELYRELAGRPYPKHRERIQR